MSEQDTGCRGNLDEVDLRDVAEILNRVYPQHSLCDCARMAAEFAPDQGSICSICRPGTYPGCVRARPSQG